MSARLRDTLLKWTILVVLLAYAVTMTVWASARADARLCTGIDVEVSGVRPALAAIVRKGVLCHLDRLAPVKGRPVGSIDLPRIQQWVSALSNLENATCAFAPDGRLVIRAEALVPEMRVFGPGGQSYYVNREGKRMQAHHEFFVDVPIATGRFDGRFSETGLLPLMQRLNADSLLGAMITMVEVRSPDNIMLIPRVQGHVVNLGDTANLDRKLTALKAFYRKVMPVRGWQTFEMVNLKYAGRVVATLRDKPASPDAGIDTVPDVEEQVLRHSDIEAPANPAPLTNR